MALVAAVGAVAAARSSTTIAMVAARPAARHRRHRRQFRRASVSPSASPNWRTASTSSPSRSGCSPSPRSSRSSASRSARSVRSPHAAACCRRGPTWRASWTPILRGTALGARARHPARHRAAAQLVRLLRLEQRLARDPSRFGKGAIEGVAGPEAANNAAALTHFIPMLTLGIPAGAAMALMLGALTIQGIAPGPAGDDRAPRPVLGRRRQHVDRQHDAAGAEPADGRALDPAAA